MSTTAFKYVAVVALHTRLPHSSPQHIQLGLIGVRPISE